MAAKKTTSSTNPAGAKTGKNPAASDKPAQKPKPVVLDPPKKTTKPVAAKKPEIVDAKVVETVPRKPDATPPPKVEPEKVDPVVVKSSKGGLLALVAGGIIAAVIGFLAADYINPPAPIADNSAEITAISADYTAKIEKLETRIATLENSPTAKLEQDIAALKQSLSGQSETVGQKLTQIEADLSDRLEKLESAGDRLTENLNISGEDISDATAALIARYGADIDAIKEQIAAQMDDREALEKRLDEVADKASAQLSVARGKVKELSQEIVESAQSVDLSAAKEKLRAAIEAGKSYADVLADIAAETGLDIPDALSDGAENGVATLTDLQESYPDAARLALKASVQAEAGDGFGSKLGAFIKAQLGARSLEEKEGDGADAVLSRAEAALGRAELGAAVDLIRQLPPDGIVAFSDWLKAADTRLAVDAALKQMDNSLDGAE